ncbi:hypothetical protein TNCV_1493371 [Trichonephila clavipes]|nr:hypothetical protein TNCV_1493371 [Trichonephila clavipes]
MAKSCGESGKAMCRFKILAKLKDACLCLSLHCNSSAMSSIEIAEDDTMTTRLEKNISKSICHGSLVVMAGMSRVQAKYPPCRGTMHIKYVEFKRPPIGVVVRRGVPAQVSSLTIFQNYEDCRQKPSCS